MGKIIQFKPSNSRKKKEVQMQKVIHINKEWRIAGLTLIFSIVMLLAFLMTDNNVIKFLGTAFWLMVYSYCVRYIENSEEKQMKSDNRRMRM